MALLIKMNISYALCWIIWFSTFQIIIFIDWFSHHNRQILVVGKNVPALLRIGDSIIYYTVVIAKASSDRDAALHFTLRTHRHKYIHISLYRLYNINIYQWSECHCVHARNAYHRYKLASKQTIQCLYLLFILFSLLWILIGINDDS